MFHVERVPVLIPPRRPEVCQRRDMATDPAGSRGTRRRRSALAVGAIGLLAACGAEGRTQPDGRSTATTAAAGGGASGTPKGPTRTGSPILWSTEPVVEGADALVAAGGSVITIGPSSIQAFDPRTGTSRWYAEGPETAPDVRVEVVDGEVLVVKAAYEPAMAFDLGTGEVVEPVPGGGVRAPPTTPLPTGYRWAGTALSRSGREIWHGESTLEPMVGRVGEWTVVNDFETGLTVVDDDGTTLASAPLGTPNWDPSPVLVSGRTAYAVTVDGVLHAISGS
jgi:hypothetical protein